MIAQEAMRRIIVCVENKDFEKDDVIYDGFIQEETMKRYRIAILGQRRRGKRNAEGAEERSLRLPLQTARQQTKRRKDAALPGTAADDEEADEHILMMSTSSWGSETMSPDALRSRRQGAIVIDNSSAYRRMKVPPCPSRAAVRLPITASSPTNCATSRTGGSTPCSPIILAYDQMTYQAVNRIGGIGELKPDERDVDTREPAVSPYPSPATRSRDSFMNWILREEMKMQNEGRKILHEEMLRQLHLRPRSVLRSHSSITVEFEKEVDLAQARALLAKAEGVRLVDNPANARYPMPLDTSDQDLVFVGRLREDISDPSHHSLTFWCCGDQIRKGAATNAVQIAELLIQREDR
ncbi:MAG: Asd/ArgC dimerization domain-containing protein [Merdibacter sp.]